MDACGFWIPLTTGCSIRGSGFEACFLLVHSSRASKGIEPLRMDALRCRLRCWRCSDLSKTLGLQSMADGVPSGSWVVPGGAVTMAGSSAPGDDRFRAFVMHVWSNRLLFGGFTCSAGA